MPSEAKPFEEVMEDKGVKIFIDPKAILFLIGTELDFVQEKLGARFVFNNPNQTSGVRLRRVVSITPAAENSKPNLSPPANAGHPDDANAPVNNPPSRGRVGS